MGGVNHVQSTFAYRFCLQTGWTSGPLVYDRRLPLDWEQVPKGRCLTYTLIELSAIKVMKAKKVVIDFRLPSSKKGKFSADESKRVRWEAWIMSKKEIFTLSSPHSKMANRHARNQETRPQKFSAFRLKINHQVHPADRLTVFLRMELTK